MKFFPALPALAIAGLCSTASARPPRSFSVTASPLWPVIGLYDLSVEYRPVPKWGFLVNGMIGDAGITTGPITTEGSFLVGRAQARRYLDVGGTHFAGEISRWRIEDEMSAPPSRHGELVQWRLGALVGHKMVSRLGLTADLQGGVNFVVHEFDTDDEAGFDPPNVLPVVRLNLGWSF